MVRGVLGPGVWVLWGGARWCHGVMYCGGIICIVGVILDVVVECRCTDGGHSWIIGVRRVSIGVVLGLDVVLCGGIMY